LIVTPVPVPRSDARVTEQSAGENKLDLRATEIPSAGCLGGSGVPVELSPFICPQAIEPIRSERRDVLFEAAQALPAGMPNPARAEGSHGL
jgi:hypothetical protein